MRAELIFDADCPNADWARENLREAMHAAGESGQWQEWERSAADAPGYVKGYGSPTVLVDGKDVAGEAASEEARNSCRLYRTDTGGVAAAPPVSSILAALRRPAGGGGWGRSLLPAAPAAFSAALPFGACPACWPLYGGILTALGVPFLLSKTWLLPLVALLLGLALFSLGRGAARRHGYAPFALGALAALLLLGGKFYLESTTAATAGAILLVSASVWNAWPKRNNAVRPCGACQTMERS